MSIQAIELAPVVLQSSNADSRMPSSYSTCSLNDFSSFALMKDVLHLPSVGVLFLAGNEIPSEIADVMPVPDETKPPDNKPQQPKVLLRCVSAGQFDSRCLMKGKHTGESSQLSRVGEHVRLIVTPEIQISNDSTTDGKDSADNCSQASVQRLRQISHSSERLDPCIAVEETTILRASSETSLGSNSSNVELKNSKSDHTGLLPIGTNVLASFKIPPPQGMFNTMGNILTSPTSSVKGNLVMLAKGVQNLGVNLDPRKMLDSTKKETSTSRDKEDEEVVMQELCTNTRIIRL